MEKIYYQDCHRKEFTARVETCTQTDKGWLVTLSATAFYPEGGGQACDLGTLGAARVLDVQEQGEQVVHLCSEPLTVGEEVTGKIDWERRFDLMQQHSGEHIVSGLIHQAFGYHNVGFHMGAELVTIDFDGDIPADSLAQIEEKANRAVWENLPIRCYVPDPEELAGITYRTKRALPWPVRIVEIPGVDTCACCGVHTALTGEIGLIKIFSCVKFRQGVRMEMACGGRALRYLSAAFEQNRQVSQAFSAKIMETGSAARKMNDMLAAEKFRSTGLLTRIFDGIAAGCTGKGNVFCLETGLDSAQVRALADRIAQCCGGMAAVFSAAESGGYAACIVTKQGEIGSFGKEMAAALSGRGGGKTGFWQGSVRASETEIRAYYTCRGFLTAAENNS